MRLLIIDEILKDRGMTEIELASAIGMSQQAVNSVIRCREKTSEKKLQRFADVLGLTTNDLFREI